MPEPTVEQDREFVESVLEGCLLQRAIAWISGEMLPEQVYSPVQMEAWAKRNGFEKVGEQ